MGESVFKVDMDVAYISVAVRSFHQRDGLTKCQVTRISPKGRLKLGRPGRIGDEQSVVELEPWFRVDTKGDTAYPPRERGSYSSYVYRVEPWSAKHDAELAERKAQRAAAELRLAVMQRVQDLKPELEEDRLVMQAVKNLIETMKDIPDANDKS